MGTHLRVLCEIYPMNIKLRGFRTLDRLQKALYPCVLDESSLSIGRVKEEAMGIADTVRARTGVERLSSIVIDFAQA